MKIGIIGAGLTGLTAGYYLSKNNHQVTIFEKENTAGGLAAGFKKPDWSWSLEYFPHHLFTSDEKAISLISQLGLSNQLFFTRPKTSVFLDHQIFQFDSPLSILAAPFLSWPQKIRTALITSFLKVNPTWLGLEKTTAHDWLNRFYGQVAYQKLWQPLLRGKFGPEAKKVNMAWFWSRIKKRSPRLGYLEGGFSVLTEKLVKSVKTNNGQVILNHEVKNLSQLKKNFDQIIITTSTRAFLKMASSLPKAYQKKLSQLKIIGALSLVFSLKESFLTDQTYWLNINQGDFPFVFMDQHTNFVEPRHYGNQHLLYVGGYYPINHRYFKMKKEQVLAEFLPFLKKINNQRLSIVDYFLFKNLAAQPIVPVGYSSMIPSHQTPISGVYLANIQQIYPWDRGMNYSIELGEKIARIVASK